MAADLRNWPLTHKLQALESARLRTLEADPLSTKRILAWNNYLKKIHWEGTPWLFKRLSKLYKGTGHTVYEVDSVAPSITGPTFNWEPGGGEPDAPPQTPTHHLT